MERDGGVYKERDVLKVAGPIYKLGALRNGVVVRKIKYGPRYHANIQPIDTHARAECNISTSQN